MRPIRMRLSGLVLAAGLALPALAVDLRVAPIPGAPETVTAGDAAALELDVTASVPGTYEYWDDLRLLIEITAADGTRPPDRPSFAGCTYNPLGARLIGYSGFADFGLRVQTSWNQVAGSAHQPVVMLQLATHAPGTYVVRYYAGPGWYSYARCDGCDVTGALGELVLTVGPEPEISDLSFEIEQAVPAAPLAPTARAAGDSGE